MNCDQLLTFQMVAATGSFTKASRKLFLTQPAVSQQIQALEASLGVQLFDRSRKKIHLTREGEILLARASRVTSELREIKQLFQELSNLSRGRLDIGSSAIFGTYFLPRPIGRFNMEHPFIEIDLHAGNSHRVLSMLLGNRIEFGFGGLFEDEPKIGFAMIHTEPYVAVVGNQNPLARMDTISPEKLREVPLILREHGTRIRDNMEAWFSRTGELFSPERFIELENVETAKRLIEEGYGVTIVPRAAVLRELESGQLREVTLPDLDLTAYYYLYYPKHRKFSRAAQAFLHLLPRAIPLSHSANIDAIIM